MIEKKAPQDSNLRIRSALKNQLKEYCAKHDLRINAVVSDLVIKFLKRKNGDG